jgi:hypothetical protein
MRWKVRLWKVVEPDFEEHSSREVVLEGRGIAEHLDRLVTEPIDGPAPQEGRRLQGHGARRHQTMTCRTFDRRPAFGGELRTVGIQEIERSRETLDMSAKRHIGAVLRRERIVLVRVMPESSAHGLGFGGFGGFTMLTYELSLA